METNLDFLICYIYAELVFLFKKKKVELFFFWQATTAEHASYISLLFVFSHYRLTSHI